MILKVQVPMQGGLCGSVRALVVLLLGSYSLEPSGSPQQSQRLCSFQHVDFGLRAWGLRGRLEKRFLHNGVHGKFEMWMMKPAGLRNMV